MVQKYLKAHSVLGNNVQWVDRGDELLKPC
jgi:hypothetical protein